MAEIITHAFVSAKSDSPDTTLVSASEWNDGHVLSGGINGQILLFDNTEANNNRWTDGPSTYGIPYVMGGTSNSPLEEVAEQTVVCNSPCLFIAFYEVTLYTSTGAATALFQPIVDGAVHGSGVTIPSSGIMTHVAFGLLAAGTHTISMTITTTGNVDILTLQIRHIGIIIGN